MPRAALVLSILSGAFGALLVFAGVGGVFTDEHGKTVGLGALDVLIIFFLACVCVAALCVWFTRGARVRTDNAADHAASRRLGGGLDTTAARGDLAYGDHTGSTLVTSLRPITVQRHFDQQTTMAIDGWMRHSFRSVSVMAGQLGGSGGMMGVGGGRAWGTSRVHLDGHSVTRVDLRGEALLAVFDVVKDGRTVDTLRIVVPPAPATTQWISGLVIGLAEQFAWGTHCQDAVAARADSLGAALTPRDISYTADRLDSLSRSTEATVAVAGVMIGNGVMAAQRLRIGDDRWLCLFPTGFPAALEQAAAAAAIGAGAGRPGTGADGPGAPGSGPAPGARKVSP
ncbi:hypothetical protein GCM10012280_42900 [Wenjunlia tyrosinilytica]|uniref:Uncharacterized protein n=2 Tax=Wenjunlia tyrosinilytica TaxID=1544741 RepID=A0A918DYL2_9ACTN|nr:hypothetical protein GCM10012280_42900 [Wenjunlia tyrosinilytica]